MQQLTREQILASFRGATRSEIDRVSFPLDFNDLDFSRLEFLGWRDRKIPRRAYVVTEFDGVPVALVLTRAERTPLRRTMCAWCRDLELDDDVVLYVARRAGERGRRGNTIGAMVCQDFACNAHVRKLPPAFHGGTDLEAIRRTQIDGLKHRVDSFVSEALNP
ncbi:MAG: FBP domain-containing protein [Gordonia sp. (in: high G+C Gram-positive bacteria)]|uniref:FBP domain-containing protein n=1 Tax=Gordonia sp. (in: high G+C Gram-positive bacteria) TaxID=84139 RepID=UPI0039E61157